jgi:hypothetical protein
MRTALIDLATACVPNGGVEDPDRPPRDCYHFPTAAEALKAIATLGLEITLPPAFLARPTMLLSSWPCSDLIAWVQRLSGDPVLPGWKATGNNWIRSFDLVIPRPTFAKPVPVRYTTAGHWQVQEDDGEWISQPYIVARYALHDPCFTGRIREILANCRRKPVDPFDPQPALDQ